MLIYPAIDLYEKEAVRLFKGDYAQKTVYSTDPVSVALDFKRQGAERVHLVDLEGARDGNTPNFDIVCAIKQTAGLFCEIGGGVRNMETVEKYLLAGIDRVILGTAAVTDESFLSEVAKKYGKNLAVGVDIKDGFVAIKGWTKASDLDAFTFCAKLEDMGIGTVICTDISRDGAMKGTNRQLYRDLSARFKMDIVASGGVSTLEDVRALREMNIHGAIIGKAYYTGAIVLSEAIEAAK